MKNFIPGLNQYGAKYLRGRVSKIYEKGGKLIVRGEDTLLGRQIEIEADMVVLYCYGSQGKCGIGSNDRLLLRPR